MPNVVKLAKLGRELEHQVVVCVRSVYHGADHLCELIARELRLLRLLRSAKPGVRAACRRSASETPPGGRQQLGHVGKKGRGPDAGFSTLGPRGGKQVRAGNTYCATKSIAMFTAGIWSPAGPSAARPATHRVPIRSTHQYAQSRQYAAMVPAVQSRGGRRGVTGRRGAKGPA